jgi:hypothetical protein
LQELQGRPSFTPSFYHEFRPELEGLADWWGAQYGARTKTPYWTGATLNPLWEAEGAEGLIPIPKAITKMPKGEVADPYSYVLEYLDTLIKTGGRGR